jgi:DNA-binding CsgD family transcriptional regulator
VFSAAPYDGGVVSWPLVGRAEELDLVLEVLRGESFSGVVIAGDMGVGKTRLAREAVAALEGELVVHWAAATPAAASIPFGALASLLPDVEVSSADDRLRLLQKVASALAERAAGQPVLLVVDDAHWLDPGAAALVHQLVVTRTARVLLTVRVEEAVPEAIVASWKDGYTERLELQPLGAFDVEALVAAALDRPVDATTLGRLWSLTRGMPLFLRELLGGALESGAFAERDGVWTWTASVDPSTRLSEILEGRFARVGPAGRSVLDHLAIGEPLGVDTLVALCGRDGVAEAERAGLAVIQDREDGEVRLAHPLHAEALRSAMGTVERRRVMARLADALEPHTGSSPAVLLRVAAWRLDSGTDAPAEVFTRAAETANALYDHVLAERLARRAVSGGGTVRGTLALGDALNRQGRGLEGLAVLEEVASLTETDQEHTAVAVARYFGLTTEYGFRPEFEEVLLAAEARIRDPTLLAFLRAQRATLLCFAGRLDDAVALVARSPHDELSELRAVPALGGAWLCGGRPESACDLASRMVPVALRHRDELPQAPGWVVSTHLPSLVAAGRLDEADAAIAFVHELVASQGAGGDGPSFVALAAGMCALHRGLPRTAARRLRESVAGMRPVSRSRLPFPLAYLAEACALCGDEDGAVHASAEADELVARSAVFEGLVRRARGWAALASGRRSTALELLLDAADWSAAHGHRTAELFALHDVVRLGHGRVAPRLGELAAVVEGRWPPVFAAHAAAVAADDGHALEAVSSDLEALGARLLAAEAAAGAGASFRRARLDARAERATARAGVLAAGCEGARPPALDELERPLPLTRREREVADLAARGLSSPAIAERLHISARTVEGHLQRTYDKLGVRDRRDLRRLLQR